MEKTAQTADRNALDSFTPEFTHYSDDIPLGENWSNQDIDHRARCITTAIVLISSGVTDSSLRYHLENVKKAGVTKAEIAAVVTHVVLYADWPKDWAIFNIAKEV